MAEGITQDLIFASLWTAVLCVIVLKFLPFSQFVSFLLICIKLSIPFVYFAYYQDGTWTFLDDLVYQEQGSSLLDESYNPLTILFNPEGLEKLMIMSNGIHILYGWWNLLAQYLFGKHYYSPVFLNVFLTFVAGLLLFRTSILFGFKVNYSKYLFIYFILNPELVCWSSFINLKDILVLTLTVSQIYFFFQIYNKKVNVLYLISSLINISLFFRIRFYIPLMLVVSLFVWLAIAQRGIKRLFLLLVAMGGGWLTLYFLSLDYIVYNFQKLSLGDTLLGFLRMLLTPQPWSVETSYSFLLIPSIVHWVLFIPAIVGGTLLGKHSKNASLIIIYALILLLLYGSYDELQGVRQRFQINFAIAWMQFHFIWLLFHDQKNLMINKFRSTKFRA